MDGTVEIIAARIMSPTPLVARSTGDLLHPLLIWLLRKPRHTDPAAFQMKEEQHIIGHQPPPGEHLHREEIGPSQHIHVCGDKILPRGSPASLRRRTNAVAAQNVSDRLVG